MTQRVVSSRSAKIPALLALLLLATWATAGLGLGSAWAQEPVAEGAPAAVELTPAQISEITLALTVKYMSPYCPGSSVRDCGSGKAAALRDEIRAWVAEGKTEAFITNELISRYGESILSAPRFKGFNMLIWIFPVLAVIVGLGVVLAFLKRQHRVSLDQRTPVREIPNEGPTDPALDRELEAELTERAR